MQEIVADTINDLEFLKLQLTTEIDGIKNGVKSLENFEAVQKYIALKQEIDETSNIIKSIELIKKVEKLRDTYTEVKQYETTPITIKYYQQKLEYLENLISVNGIIYNKEREDKIFYSKEEVLKHLISLKEQAGLSSNLTIEELNRYIDNVRKTLQAYNHYEDDKVVDEILSYKVYQNPQNYDIKNVRELPSLDLEYQYEIDNLTEREKEAFFGTEACKALGTSKEQDKVKRIGAKKNV